MKDILYFNTLEDIKLTDMMRVSKKKEEHDYSKDYLTFEALENSTLTLTIPSTVTDFKLISISYSIDNGKTWTTTQNDDTEKVITISDLSVGDKVLWKGNGYTMSTDGTDKGSSLFSSRYQFNIYGNIMSILREDNFDNITSLYPEFDYYCFSLLFRNMQIVSAKNLILSATELTTRCYYGMFLNCTVLAEAPELPATTLAEWCYGSMFSGCNSLITAPALPATTLQNYCYANMFQDCIALTTAPKLPATTLIQSCYLSMFSGCTALTAAPDLPATTLVASCYNYMLNGCSKLNYIKAMFTTTPSSNFTKAWVTGVAITGTFVKNANASWNITGVVGIPSGWTVETTDN